MNNNVKKVELNELVKYSTSVINSIEDEKMKKYIKNAQEYYLDYISKQPDQVSHAKTNDSVIQNENNFEKYVENILNRKDSVSKKYNELINNLDDILKNPNDRLMETWANNFSSYCDINNLNKGLIIKYLNVHINNQNHNINYSLNSNFKIVNNSIKKDDIKTKTDIEQSNTSNNNKQEEVKENIQNEKEEAEKNKEPEILKIRNVKKVKRTKKEAIALSASALCFYLNCGLNPLGFAICLGYGINRLVKNRMYKKSLMRIFNKYNIFYNDQTNELCDEYGVAIDENYSDKAMYQNIKTELISISALKEKKKHENIKEKIKLGITYRKNRLVECLTNSKRAKSAIDYWTKNEHKITDYAYDPDNYEEEYKNEVSKKGMGGL